MDLNYDVVNLELRSFVKKLFGSAGVTYDFAKTNVNGRYDYIKRTFDTFREMRESVQTVLNIPYSKMDFSEEDMRVLCDNRTEEEKRLAMNARMREWYAKLKAPNSTFEIYYKGGLPQFYKDVESGMYDD